MISGQVVELSENKNPKICLTFFPQQSIRNPFQKNNLVLTLQAELHSYEFSETEQWFVML